RAAENVVFQLDSGIDGNIVLDFHVVADTNAAGDVHVLPKITFFADLAIGHNVREVPDFGAVADRAWLVENGRRVDKVFRRSGGLKGNWFAMLAERFTRCVQDFQNAKSIFAIGVGRFA